MKKFLLGLALVAGCAQDKRPESPVQSIEKAQRVPCEVWNNGRVLHVITDDSFWHDGACRNCRFDLNNNLIADSYEVNSSN